LEEGGGRFEGKESLDCSQKGKLRPAEEREARPILHKGPGGKSHVNEKERRGGDCDVIAWRENLVQTPMKKEGKGQVRVFAVAEGGSGEGADCLLLQNLELFRQVQRGGVIAAVRWA